MYVTGFFRFWYDFIVGDDWRVAAVIVALAVTALLAHALFTWVILVFLDPSLRAASKPK